MKTVKLMTNVLYTLHEVKGITVEELEEKWEEEGHDYIEENFGDPEDHWKNFTGKLTVTDVTDEYSK
jgi:hypothetical protein